MNQFAHFATRLFDENCKIITAVLSVKEVKLEAETAMSLWLSKRNTKNDIFPEVKTSSNSLTALDLIIKKFSEN